jgi:hypothetical protein
MASMIVPAVKQSQIPALFNASQITHPGIPDPQHTSAKRHKSHMNRKLTDEDVRTARGMLKRGKTKTDVAKMLGVSRRALGFALDREIPEDPAPGGSRPGREDPEIPPAPTDRDLSAVELGLPPDAGTSEIDEQIARCQRNQTLAESEGDLAEQRQQANMIRQFLALRERINARQDPDAIVIPKGDVEATLNRARFKFTAMMNARPMLCAHCSKALSVAWAKEPLEPTKEETQ